MSIGIYNGVHFGDGDETPLADDMHPDFMLRRSEERTPIEKLCQSLLLNALEDAHHKNKEIRDAAIWWLNNGRARVRCDFVCELLDIRYQLIADYVAALTKGEEECRT